MKKKTKSNFDNNKKPFSYHAFLFPFKWEILLSSIESFGVRCNLNDFENILCLNNSLEITSERKSTLKWHRKPFTLDQQLAYNEYNYFYDFVRDVIYDKGDKEVKEFNLKSIIHHYEFALPKNESFFEIKTAKKKLSYRLKIRKIQLDVYETGVGIFSYHLENDAYPNPDDILNINQYGRRIFVGGYELPASYYDARKHLSPNDVKFVDLADWFKVSFADLPPIIEDFQVCKNFKNFESAPFFLPKTITELITFNINDKNKSTLLTTEWSYQPSDSKIWIAPSIDDRMFVHCWYRYTPPDENQESIIPLTSPDFNTQSEFWYKYTFIDHQDGESHRNIRVKNEIIEKSTYTRWAGYGTLYGVSKYSFTMLCAKDTPEYLLSVHETMYLKMAELSLIQRATVLRFSDEVQYINSIQDESKKNELIRGLYEYHIRFVNKIDFREITPQEQGIELYDMIQKTMRINEQVDYLDKELNELHNYSLLLEEKKRAEEDEKRTIEEKRRDDKLAIITYIGVPATFISLILSLIGLIKDINKTNTIEKGKEEIETYQLEFYNYVWLVESVCFFLMAFSGYKLWKYFNTHSFNWRNAREASLILVFVLSFILSIVAPFISQILPFF